MAKIWRLATHHKYQLDALDWYRSERFIALNWGWTGDLRTDEPAASEQAIQELIGPTDDHHAARCLWEFWRVMEINDLVILRLSDEYSNDCVVRVGDYYWAVSYTHLDVYKRQIGSRRDRHRHRRFDSPAGGAVRHYRD